MQEDNSNSSDEKPNANKSQACLDVIRYVENNDITALRQWITNRGDENDGWPALHEAASRRDRKECLELLLEYSDNVLDPQLQSLWRETALYIACDCNHEEYVLLLLQKGYNPNTLSPAAIGKSLLHIATEKGNENIVKHLLHYGADINHQNLGLSTALHIAVSNNNVEIGRILLENNADLRLRNISGLLPTHLASRFGRADLLRLILDADPSIINVEDGMKHTALHHATTIGDIDCTRCLCEKGAKMTGQEFENIPKETSNTSKVELVKLLVELAKTQVKLPDPSNDDDEEWLNSFTCDVIDLHSVECLSVLLKSGLPEHIVQAPRFSPDDDGNYDFLLSTPLAYLLNLNRSHLSDEIVEAMMRLLLDHDIIFADEYFRKSPLGRFDDVIFVNIQADRLRFYHQILSDKGVTADYAVQCFCNIMENVSVGHVNRCWPHYYLSQFSDNFDYTEIELGTLQFLIRNSSLLEPGLLSDRIIADIVDDLYDDEDWLEIEPAWNISCYSMYNYLTDLEPTYYVRAERGVDQKYLDLWERFSPVADEFDKSTLKQLCRTAIRKSLRGKSAKEDLSNFRRKLNELSTPLPISLKNYLLYND